MSLLGRFKESIKADPATRPLYLWYRHRHTDGWSRFDNIFYCCTQKTGSQWFKTVFRDPTFQRYTGLDVEPYVALGLKEARFERAFPVHSLVAHLYIDHPTFLSIPKTDNHRAFFILRDPRDAVVSWYFSMRSSHTAYFDVVAELRRDMAGLDQHQGMVYTIDRLEEFGFFAAQRSWLMAPPDARVRILRYEDFAGDNATFLRDLLDFLEVRIPDAELGQLCERHAFSRYAKGRNQGQENQEHHYRSGVAGDWRRYFTPEITEHFRKVTGDTLELLGYE